MIATDFEDIFVKISILGEEVNDIEVMMKNLQKMRYQGLVDKDKIVSAREDTIKA